MFKKRDSGVLASSSSWNFMMILMRDHNNGARRCCHWIDFVKSCSVPTPGTYKLSICSLKNFFTFSSNKWRKEKKINQGVSKRGYFEVSGKKRKKNQDDQCPMKTFLLLQIRFHASVGGFELPRGFDASGVGPARLRIVPPTKEGVAAQLLPERCGGRRRDDGETWIRKVSPLYVLYLKFRTRQE